MASVLKQKSFDFACEIIKFFQVLKDEKVDYSIAKQVLRSGTSIGANISEAQFAESTADFIHKMHIAQKEASETEYWFDLLINSGLINEEKISDIKPKLNEILKMLTATIVTSKANLDKNRSNAKNTNN